MARQPRVRSKNALQKQRNQQFLDWLANDERNLQAYRQFSEAHQNEMQRNENALNRRLGVLDRQISTREQGLRTSPPRDLQRQILEAQFLENQRMNRSYMEYKNGGDGTTPYNAYDVDRQRYIDSIRRNMRRIQQANPPRLVRTIDSISERFNPLERLIDIAVLLENPIVADAPTTQPKKPKPKPNMFFEPDAIQKDKLYNSYLNSRNKQS